MSDKAGGQQPPPYSQGNLDQYSMHSQYGGQQNTGFSGSNPGFPQPGAYGGQFSSNVVVTQVGGHGGTVYQPVPYDYSTQAWIACLCCFWPTGLLAIMKASESRDALARGDYVAAQSASDSARTLVRVSYVIGILSLVAVIVFIAVWFSVVVNSINCYNC